MGSRGRFGSNFPVTGFFLDLLETLYSTPYGGSVTQRVARCPARSFFQSSGFLASPQSSWWGPSFHSCPGLVMGLVGSGGVSSSFWSGWMAGKLSMTRFASWAVKPVNSKVGSSMSSLRMGASFSLSHSPLILLRARLSSAKSALARCLLSRTTGTVPVYPSSLRAWTRWWLPIILRRLSVMMGSTTPKCSMAFLSLSSSWSAIVLGFLLHPLIFYRDLFESESGESHSLWVVRVRFISPRYPGAGFAEGQGFSYEDDGVFRASRSLQEAGSVVG